MQISWLAAVLWYCRVIAVVVLAQAFLNGIVMLIAPRVWSEMPAWLRGTATTIVQRFGKRQGVKGVRVYGAVLTAMTSAIIAILISRKFF